MASTAEVTVNTISAVGSTPRSDVTCVSAPAAIQRAFTSASRSSRLPIKMICGTNSASISEATAPMEPVAPTTASVACARSISIISAACLIAATAIATVSVCHRSSPALWRLRLIVRPPSPTTDVYAPSPTIFAPSLFGSFGCRDDFAVHRLRRQRHHALRRKRARDKPAFHFFAGRLRASAGTVRDVQRRKEARQKIDRRNRQQAPQ